MTSHEISDLDEYKRSKVAQPQKGTLREVALGFRESYGTKTSDLGQTASATYFAVIALRYAATFRLCSSSVLENL